MYKLVHIHQNSVFLDHSRRYINDNIHNEIIFIGEDNDKNRGRLNAIGIEFRIIANSVDNVEEIVTLINTFDGVIFNDLKEIGIRVLFQINRQVKRFLKLFGTELYFIDAKPFLSERTLEYQIDHDQNSLVNHLKRKLKIFLNKEFFLQKDNQKKIFKQFDAILIMSKYEYDELRKYYYLPRLIERQLIDQANDLKECFLQEKNSKNIILGNSGIRWNNHLEILDIISSSRIEDDIRFDLFFSYGTDSRYSQEVKSKALQIPNCNLIEEFLQLKEFEAIYKNASALVLNSYRQHGVGNIFTAVKYGCKIYLNKRSSSYHWLKSLGFLISEVAELKNDIETGNVSLSLEEQERNFDCFVKAVNAYTIQEYQENIISVLNEK